jgi:hypothetical protein
MNTRNRLGQPDDGRRAMHLPLLVGVGPTRTGTTWLHDMFFAHPESAVTRVKEVNYFMSSQPADWYARQFQRTTPATKLRVDMSPKLFETPGVAARIAREIRNPIVLIGLRNPYDRLHSCYVKFGAMHKNFSAMAAADLALMGSAYMSTRIREYADHVGRECIVFFPFDELQRDRVATAKDLQHRLGLNYYESPSIMHKVNASDVAAATGAARMLARAAPGLRQLVKYRWPMSELYRKVYADRSYICVEEVVAVFRDCARYFEPDISQLERLLEMDLSGWRLDPAFKLARRLGQDCCG